MSELVTIIGIDRATVDAQLSIEKSGRPGKIDRVLRRGEFGKARFNLMPADRIHGVSGAAERSDGAGVYVLVVEFV